MGGISINTDSLKQLGAQLQSYFSSLSQTAIIGWGLIGLGIMLLIASLALM